MNIIINIGGDSRTQEDKIGVRSRKRLIDAGLLIPGRISALPPFMHEEAIERTKQHLYKHGIITPKYMKEQPTTKELIEARTHRLCRRCRASQWLCPCGALE